MDPRLGFQSIRNLEDIIERVRKCERERERAGNQLKE